MIFESRISVVLLIIERETDVSNILSFLRGGKKDFDVCNVAQTNPDLLARAILYQVTSKKYHRKNLCRALLALMTYSSPYYRQIAWALIQLVPFSHLLILADVVTRPEKENTRRLRHALANKIAHLPPDEIFRSFFISPSTYRKFFNFFKLPREKIKGNKITHEIYRVAVTLAQMSVIEAMQFYEITPTQLVKKYKIPLHMVFQYVQDTNTAQILADESPADDFFRHARWFREILGDSLFEKIALKKAQYVSDPVSFLGIKDHLVETQAFTPQLIDYFERQSRKMLQKIFATQKLERIALIVDVSGSMEIAKSITLKLYEAFSLLGKSITDLIAFNNIAFEVSPNELKNLSCGGSTSIGAAFILLEKRLRTRNSSTYPDIIILITDLEENTEPYLKKALPLLEKRGFIPLVILLCGYITKYPLNYPHALIPIKDFHSRLLIDIVKEVARLSSQIKHEEELTKTTVARRPLEETIGELKLPQRPPESLKPGYLAKLLTS